jgi:hypothetical protein
LLKIPGIARQTIVEGCRELDEELVRIIRVLPGSAFSTAQVSVLYGFDGEPSPGPGLLLQRST